MDTGMKVEIATCKTMQINWSHEKIEEPTSITSHNNTNLQLTYTTAIFFVIWYVFMYQKVVQ